MNKSVFDNDNNNDGNDFDYITDINMMVEV